METSEKKLGNFVASNPQFTVFEITSFVKKELTGKDCYYLRYCLMRFIFENRQRIYEYMDTENEKEIYYHVDEEASICDNSLYMGNFEGYQISENESIKALEMSIDNRVVLNVYNNITDSYTNYLID